VFAKGLIILLPIVTARMFIDWLFLPLH